MISNNQMAQPNMLGEQLVQNPSYPYPYAQQNDQQFANYYHQNTYNTYIPDQNNNFTYPGTQPYAPNIQNTQNIVPLTDSLGFEKLQRLGGIFIKRKAGKCCKKYVHQHHFYPLDHEKKYQKGTKIFRSTENLRLCPLTFGPHDTSVKFYDKFNSNIEAQPFIHLEKEDVCSWGCATFPINVFLTEGNQKTFIGKTQRVPKCGLLEFEVKDSNEVTHFMVKLTTPQCCSMPKYEIKTVDGMKVGEIEKHWFGWCALKSGYKMVFPERATGLERVLLVATVMAIERIEFDSRNKH